jgi:transcriptional regulator with XRE-family HTH domain
MEKSLYSRKYRRLLRYLRKVRKKLKLTQEEVDKKLGAYRTFMSKTESGQRRLDVVELHELCKIYALPVRRIFRLLEKDDPQSGAAEAKPRKKKPPAE